MKCQKCAVFRRRILRQTRALLSIYCVRVKGQHGAIFGLRREATAALGGMKVDVSADRSERRQSPTVGLTPSFHNFLPAPAIPGDLATAYPDGPDPPGKIRVEPTGGRGRAERTLATPTLLDTFLKRARGGLARRPPPPPSFLVGSLVCGEMKGSRPPLTGGRRVPLSLRLSTFGSPRVHP